ncbi:hypothetical protein GCM10009839_70920 [Catenulispora yoronensis]|uniref:SseB protein N-terminal domain-containing protein n=1 Tax=Catenulispora yoronensis TaxID=450799 RepID=A0ABN2V9A1_9ACTN
MAPVTEVLADYAGGHASRSDVVRALLAHDGWYAPMLWLNEAFPERKVYDRMIPTPALGQAPGPGRLWLFTGPDQVQAAIDAGAAFAAAGGPVPGTELFGALTRAASEVRVNPAAPAEQEFLMGVDDELLDYLARWIDAVLVEAALLESTEDLGPRLAAFEHYIVPVDETGRPRVVTMEQPRGNHVMAFTAPDLFMDHQKRDGGVTGGAEMAAKALFQLADYDGVEGVVLNMTETDSFVLPTDLCQAVLKLIS